jgi:hypothetical protein
MTFCEGEETQRETTGRLVEDVGFVNEILGGKYWGAVKMHFKFS